MKKVIGTCEVCNEAVEAEDGTFLSGCEKCGRLFGPCCNSVDPNYCIECVS